MVVGQACRPRRHVQVIAAPDGWPIWTSDVRPGREHDTTALRTHPEALPLLAEWTDAEHAALADLGYEGEVTIQVVAGIQTFPLVSSVRTSKGRRPCLAAVDR